MSRTITIALTALATVALVGWTAAPEDRTPPPATQPVATQPAATQPAGATRPTRPSAQEEIVQSLLREQERAALIPPQPAADQRPEADQTGLLPDGTILIERPGRFVLEDGRPKFVFISTGEEHKLRSMEVLANSLREAMERQAQAGATEFIISGEVTRYRGANYLLLRKLLQRVSNRNLSP